MMSWSSQKKKSALVVSFILSKGDSFNTFGLSQCIVYWINFQTIYTFTFLYKKLHQFIHFWCLFFWTVRSLHCILRKYFSRFFRKYFILMFALSLSWMVFSALSSRLFRFWEYCLVCCTPVGTLVALDVHNRFIVSCLSGNY